MVKALSNLCAFGILAFSIVTCTLASSSQLLETRSADFEFADAVLVYEDISSSSAATGACRTTALDRWYGTNAAFGTIEAVFIEDLADGNWETWPDDVYEQWHFDTRGGLYTVFLTEIETLPLSDLDILQIPEEYEDDFTPYSTIFLLSIIFMSRQQADDCFEYHYHRYP